MHAPLQRAWANQGIWVLFCLAKTVKQTVEEKSSSCTRYSLLPSRQNWSSCLADCNVLSRRSKMGRAAFGTGACESFNSSKRGNINLILRTRFWHSRLWLRRKSPMSAISLTIFIRDLRSKAPSPWSSIFATAKFTNHPLCAAQYGIQSQDLFLYASAVRKNWQQLPFHSSEVKNTKLSRPRNRSPSFRPSLKMAMAMGEAGNFLPFFFSSINKSGAAELPRG